MENLTIHNAIELGEDISLEAKGKGRHFQSRFIEAGLAHYEQFGDVLITKETLDKFIFSMVGCPVIIKHKDITEENADKERVGVVSKVWYNELDGWYWCEGIIWDKQAIDLVKNQGWSVSCTYDFESDFKKGTYHGKDYDMEFTGGEFLHLALVPNPRYERANIVVNSKDNEKGKWVTIKGTHVFIPEGKQVEEVVKEKFGKDKESKSSDKDRIKISDLKSRKNEILKEYWEAKEGSSERERLQYDLDAITDEILRLEDKQKESKEDPLKGKYMKEDADFDEEQVKKDIAAAKEKGYESIEEISEYLGLDEDETRTFVEEKEESATFDDEAFERFIKKEREASTSQSKGFDSYAYDIFKSVRMDGANRLKKSDDGYEYWFEIPRENFNNREKVLLKRLKKDKRVEEFDTFYSNKLSDKHTGFYIKFKKLPQNSNEGDITMTVLNELKEFIQNVVNNKGDDMEAKNEKVDKRDLIRQIMAIAGKEEASEDVRTIAKLAEKLAYDKSEAGTADNKCKNEEDEEKEEKFEEEKEIAENKCKNEEEDKKEEDKEDKKEDKKEKVENSIEDTKRIVFGGTSEKQTDYIPHSKRIEMGNNY